MLPTRNDIPYVHTGFYIGQNHNVSIVDHQAFKKEGDWEVEDDYGTWRLSMPGSL